MPVILPLMGSRFKRNPRLYGMCHRLYTQREWLWKFLDIKRVEPTNNARERSLRHAVIWRKLSIGTKSAAGSRFAETILTVVETCRQQSRNVFAFVAEAVQAHFAIAPARHRPSGRERLPGLLGQTRLLRHSRFCRAF